METCPSAESDFITEECIVNYASGKKERAGIASKVMQSHK